MAAPAIPAAIQPAVPLPDNPWRRKPQELTEEVAPVVHHEPPTPVAVIGQEPPTAVAAVQQPATRIPVLSFDPLPPIEEVAAESHYSALEQAAAQLQELPSIPVEEADGVAEVRGVARSAEVTLALPTAYATFAPETEDVAPYAPEWGTADVVEIDFPAAPTVAPPAAPVTGWSDVPAVPVAQIAEA